MNHVVCCFCLHPEERYSTQHHCLVVTSLHSVEKGKRTLSNGLRLFVNLVFVFYVVGCFSLHPDGQQSAQLCHESEFVPVRHDLA